MTIIAKETCYLCVISHSVYKKILSTYLTEEHAKKLDFLRNIPLVKDWSNNELSDLLPHAKRTWLYRKNVLYDIGDACTSVYLIKHGEIEVFYIFVMMEIMDKKDYKRVTT